MDQSRIPFEMSSNNRSLLIDFSSPAVTDNHKPLIPVPCTKGNPALSPVNNNPFDIVATQTESPLVQNDPFELVFRTAFKDSCDPLKSERLNDVQNESTVVKTSHRSLDFKTDKNFKEHFLSPSDLTSIGIRQDNSLIGNEGDTSKISIGDCSSIKLDDTDTKHQPHFPVQNNLETNISETEDKSQNSGDFSTEEGLKAVIASRVSKCIERVLNNTVDHGKRNKTTDDLNKSVKSEERYHRRSLSASVLKKEFLQNFNSSLAGGIFVLKNDEKTFTPRLTVTSTSSNSTSSSRSTGILNQGFITSRLSVDECISPVVNETSAISDENVFIEEQVFKEAKKLANTFSEIASRKCHSPGREAEEDNDLMACKPDFLYADSSEDEAELLRKDPSLNFHSSNSRAFLSQSFTSDKKPTIESDALSRFKNRSKDSSLGDLEKTSKLPNDISLRRSHSWDAPVSKEMSQPRFHIPVPVALLNPEESAGTKPLRVKKVSVEPIKRGPIKAVVPVQNMTRPLEEKAAYEAIGEKIPGKEISPEYFQQSKKTLIVTPLKKSNPMKEPIAASTPNRSHSASSLITQFSPIVAPSSIQRRSLDTQQKLMTIPLSASMKRSSSSSGVSKTRPGTSNLQLSKSKEPQSNKSEIIKNVKGRSFEKKKPGLQEKLAGPNPRALSDLPKTALLKPMAAKASGKILSKLKRGVGMDPVSKNKENIVPE